MVTETRSIKERLVALARSPWIVPLLFGVQVLETTFVPMPYEALFVALCLAARERIWLFTLITVAGSLVAGAVMYGVGAMAVEPVAAWLGAEAAIAEYQARFKEEGASFILLGGATPAPSFLINMAAGASSFPFLPFIAYFGVSRFVRFAVIGGMVYLYGDEIGRWWANLPKPLRRGLTFALLAAIAYWFYAGFRG